MSWEQRKGKRYYTRSRRQNGKVVREYFGRGPIAEMMSTLDLINREEREEQRELERIQLDDRKKEFESIDQYLNSVKAIESAALAAEGFHQHKRGEWRRRRDQHSN